MPTKLEAKLYSLFTKPRELVPRSIFFNQELPDELINPKTGKTTQVFEKNEIRTTKYTPLSFLPKNLFFQFHNIANIYFLFLIILGAFQIFGVENPALSAVPLIVIVFITAVKDALEDSRRTISDLELNNNPVSILHGIQNLNVNDRDRSFRSKVNNFNSTIFVKMVKFFAGLFGKKDKVLVGLANTRNSIDTVRSDQRMSLDGLDGNDVPSDILTRLNTKDTHKSYKDSKVKFSKRSWKDVRVGDIVRIHNHEECPADIVILSTSDIDNKCYIETKNLDGETNLKSRVGLNNTFHLKRSKNFENVQFELNSEAPNLNMYTYQGSFNYRDSLGRDSQEPINIENLALRGCTIRNTKWVIGFVVFTGADSKIMLNSGITPTKRSRISKELNLSVIINFAFLFILCFVSGLVNGIFYDRDNTSFTFFEYDAYGSTAAINGIITFFVVMNIYQALVPISLYITVEIIKTAQAYFIYSDVKMYHEALDYPCTPKSWNISDDLGQVEYIFSDKTGTLTQNVMEFKKSTVGGKKYGLAYTEAQAGMDKRKGINVEEETAKWMTKIEQDKNDMINELKKVPQNVQFNEDKLTFISSEFAKDLLNKESPQSELNHNFMLSLALCHTVLTEPVKENPELNEFKAESPDEAALVEAANDVGYTFVKRTRNGGVLRIHGKEIEFEVLKILEFNSSRKRMSIIVKIEGELKIITKGADSVIFSRLDPSKNEKEFVNKTAENLEEFASEGLRTLCVASRNLTQEEFQLWEKKYDAAASSLDNREDQIEAASNLIEKDFILHGGTAIEDRLQSGVPESIERLGKAGLKLWVLTGDKIETAINIGFSCNLLGNDMTLLVISLFDSDEADDETDVKGLVDKKLDEYLQNFQMTGSLEELKLAKEDHSIPSSKYAVIIDGATLSTVFEDDDLQRKLLLLCKQCKSVLCCRVSPAQKASVVQLVRDSLNVMTLAIGDGANDVAMIQTANVGVGIVGEEGRQAAMSSDYAIGQFRFLTRLLLVHGRWDYKRLAEVIPVFFYKNVTFTLTLFWYGIYNDFDGSYLIQFTIIMLYNLAFTSLPVIFLGIFDQDVSDTVSLQVPQLYKSGILRQEWSQYKFLYYMADGIYQSAVSFFFPYLIFYTGAIATYDGLDIAHRFWIGVIVIHIAVTACNIYALLRQKRWDWLSLVINLISTLLLFFWIGVYSATLNASEFYKAAPQVYGSLAFWVCYVSGVIACVLPRFVFSSFNSIYRPRDIDIIRECVARGDFDESRDGANDNWSDQEKADLSSSQDGQQYNETLDQPRSSLQTTHALPGLSQAHSLVQTFTQASSINNR
jgi:phospholipid-translocating ATPase